MEFEPRTDHLIYASPNLEAAVNHVAGLLGVEPGPGGSHPEFGTANALLRLGPESYLEIIGPDPENPAFAGARPFGIDHLAGPRLAAWAVRESNLEARFETARLAGYDPGEIMRGHRLRPDGVRLNWRLGMFPGFVPPSGGLIPFLIDWEGTPHPAVSAVEGCRLVSLSGEHPDPTAVIPSLASLGVSLTVVPGTQPGLTASIESPAGTIRLT